MHETLNGNLFLVKEHRGVFKAANHYDIYDPQTEQIVLECREENLGGFSKVLRFTDFKRMTPFDIHVKSPDGRTAVRIKRGVSIFLSDVRVQDESGVEIGGFKQKFFSIGGAFTVLDASDNPICKLKGKWTGWDFKFLADDGKELAQVTKKWAGLGRELFTSADNYVLSISETIPPNDSRRQLIMAAVLCIDMVLKE